MNEEINVLLVFCEGPHDSAFVRLVFRKIMDYKIEKMKFSEMPAPFNNLFHTAMKKHSAEDMALDMAHKFFLPDTVLRNEKNMAFIFNCGGKTKYENVRIFLSSYLILSENVNTFRKGAKEIAQSVKYLFLYDSDTDGIDTIVANLNRELGEIDEKKFIVDSWTKTKSAFGRIAKDKAVFVWGRSPDEGTLEDILMPMFAFDNKNRIIVQQAEAAMKNMFQWKMNDPEKIRSVAETVKFQKAVLTTVGQREKPGSSLNVILEHSKLITDTALSENGTTMEFAEFVNEFIGK
ncbi:MAG: hypothetical protein HQL89_01710 [Magnetococcales bacterium]|nr:hypothetical protein [Magnetococcales bacterium]